jgi:lysophospholipase L1-like esterase
MKLKLFAATIPFFLLLSCGSQPKLNEKEAWDTAADELRKSKMSEEELRWEKQLERNLSEGELTPYFVVEDPKLPRVLLLGDSQSMAYTLKVRERLEGVANIIRVPESAQASTYAVENIKRWLNTTTTNKKWDLIHFHFGLNDKETELYTYAQNIRQFVRVLKKTKAKLLWSNTTPTKPREISIKLNEISARTMKANKIPIVDLYAATLPFINEDQKYGEALNDDGLDTVAAKIASAIKEELKK